MSTTSQRPESWNAKMLSGAPLITDKQFDRLIANAPASLEEMEDHDPIPVVKIFLPHIRWLLVWIYPDDRDRAFAVVRMGNYEPEMGDVLPAAESGIGRCHPHFGRQMNGNSQWRPTGRRSFCS